MVVPRGADVGHRVMQARTRRLSTADGAEQPQRLAAAELGARQAQHSSRINNSAEDQDRNPSSVHWPLSHH